MTNKAESDPRDHVRRMARFLQEAIGHLRQDIDAVDEPQVKAMFETSADVLLGLKKAYSDFEQKKESAWPGGRELHG
jgi:rubrerythrin